MKDGRLKSIGIPLTIEELKRRCCLILETTPVDITDSIWTSGEIPRVTTYEEPEQSLLMEWKGCVFTDPLKDDMSLVIKGEGDMVLLCGAAIQASLILSNISSNSSANIRTR
jgi:7,8-dihydropterin-6-yl-methyl-4-(beta-D-ribofuranosyl)aminobenzene 5'-phosphate synthase